jgi:hypothetical protein
MGQKKSSARRLQVQEREIERERESHLVTQTLMDSLSVLYSRESEREGETEGESEGEREIYVP